jgi:DnaJ-class molecular chaperone
MGATMTIVNRCPSCGGTGEARKLDWLGYDCRTCEGSGRVIVIDGLPCAVQPNGTYRDAKGKFRRLPIPQVQP